MGGKRTKYQVTKAIPIGVRFGELPLLTRGLLTQNYRRASDAANEKTYEYVPTCESNPFDIVPKLVVVDRSIATPGREDTLSRWEG